MAACGSLEHIFDKPLQPAETPTTLLESLSTWKRIKSIDSSSFTELFGELHFKESNAAAAPEPSSSSSLLSSSPFPLPFIRGYTNPPQGNIDVHQGQGRNPTGQHGRLQSFSSMNSDSLSLCTEGLGFESFDDVEDLFNKNNIDERKYQEETRHPARSSLSRRSRTQQGAFPPPISCIGRNGKPWVFFKSYRQDGRFILQEIRIPTQEFLHACRENGRLRLQFMSDDEFDPQHDNDDQEEEEEEEEEDNIEGGSEGNVETTRRDRQEDFNYDVA